MTTSNTTPSVSRRTALAGLSAGGLALALGGSPAAAQDATPTALVTHPLVGDWVLTGQLPAPAPAFVDRVFIAADGSLVDVDHDGVVSLGAWAPTGARTAHLMLKADNPQGGIFTTRATLAVAPDGRSFSASYTFEILFGTGGAGTGQYGPGTATGSRMPVDPRLVITVVEGPGTPVGSLDDLFNQFPTPEATPAS
jgi:hypothetical protein